MSLIGGRGFGLEIIQRVRERSNGKILLNEGSVYPALKALERDGLLRSYDGEPLPERGGRPRRYYELTGEGRRVATEQRVALLNLLQPVEAY
ncbi:PadR family transcriptional regulator [Archangium sp.]|uniref:PadR family transcriptional regulator n=1 Tax=Archangium sp. TaxID=1872627 RepID=UPI00286BDC3C|nr:PadR family transcriptional regulator [Archangium sp.]